MFKVSSAWLLCLTLLSAANLVSASVTIQEQVNHYHFFAKTLKDFDEEIGKYSGSTQWTGFTHASLRYFYDLKETSRECRPENLRVNLNIRYKMPKLFPTYKEAAVKTRFERYYYGLKIHEDGHGRVWRMAAGEMDRDLSMASAGSCDELRNILAEKYKAFIAKYRKKNQRYDAITDHGRAQNRLASNFFGSN